nr:MAG TPA: hypothetical protein [Caudoviricetes sp.]
MVSIIRLAKSNDLANKPQRNVYGNPKRKINGKN